MARWRALLWILWALCLASLAAEVLLVHRIPPRATPWVAAQTAVAGFVLSLFALTASVGSFALRESFAERRIREGSLDPRTPAGFARVRATLFALWALCLGVGALGIGLAYGAGSPRAAWPYAAGGGALLILHAPRRRLFTAPAAESAQA